MRYKPKIGDEFPITKDVIVAKTRLVTEVTRSVIALSVVSLGVLALLVAAVFCAHHGDFQALQTLWEVIAAPMGCIIWYYFRGTLANDEKDHTGAA
jgi:hypothetical protein